ncbi:MAG: hypothetical protein COB66_04920 [Coxiella sp. (in: Bacteria)]|nr:MAG: hypothetical protein COB66_04920 [Coxiella sp. (in: g-proteobacteria)]
MYLDQNNLKIAINYHDSYLPKYAGLNSTTWAISNQEKTHGITWHQITSDIDKGDIIKQVKFDIDHEETAASLNIKCADYAYGFFEELVEGIEADRLVTCQQNSTLTPSYYGKKNIPENYAIISQLSNFNYILSLDKALDFGGNENSVSTLKIKMNNNYYILSGISPEPIDNGVEIVDGDNHKIYAKLVLDIYGNELSEHRNKYYIDNIVLNGDEMGYLAVIKQSEDKSKRKLKSYLNNNPLVTTKKDAFTLKFAFNIDQIDKNKLFTGIFYLLSKILNEDEIVSHYHDMEFPENIMNLVNVRSFMLVNKEQDEAVFIDNMTALLSVKLTTTKDFDYRYSLNCNTNIAVSSCGMNINSQNHNILILFDGNEAKILSRSNDGLTKNIVGFFQNVLTRIDWIQDLGDSLSFVDKAIRDSNLKLYQKINNTKKDYNNSLLLHEIFEQQAKLTPNSIAIEDETSALTYHELDARANILANCLLSHGLINNQYVAMSVDRTLNLPLVILAILKSGGAYLPIDSNYPAERKAYILSDSDAQFLIVDEKTDCQFPDNKNKINLEHIDFHNQPISKKPTINGDFKNNAYMIYTSGTTGKPKGVVVNHENISERMLALLEIYKVDTSWRHLQYGSYSFDASLEELFLALMVGGTVVVASDDTAKDPNLLIDAISRHQITAINFVPSVLSMFLAAIENKNLNSCRSLRCVIAGGEVLSRNTVESFYRLFDCVLYNTYGPTENTIDSTYYITDKKDTNDAVLIGQPLPNSTVYVFDKNMELVGCDQQGELYVGGVGVSVGYHNNATLTEQKFINNPIQESWDSVLYRTGDVVKINLNNQIEFISRIDDQVKIRGLRIELAEIQNVLSTCDFAKHILVQVKENDNLGKYIAVYYIASDNIDLVDQLRKRAMQQLPSYMLPSSYTRIQQIPLTANGKLNYHALPEPTFETTNKFSLISMNNTEKLLFSLFQEVLGVNNVNVNDRFFDLGGHSLMAIQLISKLSTLFGEKVPVKILFENPTIKSLAIFIDENYTFSTFNRQENKRIVFISRSQLIQASYEQQAIWFVDKMLPGNAAYDIPAIYKLSGEMDFSLLNEAIKQLLEQNEILRTVFNDHDGVPYLNVKPVSKQVLSLVDYSDKTVDYDQEKIAIELSEELSRQSYHLSQGPLYRFTLLKFSKNKFYLLINMHHTVFDGVSSRILTEQLTEIYNNFFSGHRLKFANKAIQYADYAYWNRNRISEGLIDEQLIFWKKQFSKPAKLLQLPLDYQRPKVLPLEGRSINFELTQEKSAKLYELSIKLDCSVYSILLSAFSILLYKYSQQEKITIGTAIANRTEPEIENMIGLFVNILPLNIHIINDNADRFIKAVHQYVMEALSNKDIVLEQLFSQLDIARDSSYHPLFQVMFVMENMEKEDFSFNSVSSQKILPGHHESKYDLSLYIDESHKLIKGRFEYNLALFKEPTIQSMLEHYLLVLDSLTHSGATEINELSLLTKKDRTLVDDYNQTTFLFDKQDFLLHDLFEEQAAINPENIALQAESVTFTYLELNNKANSLANILQGRGIEKGDVVSILMSKGCEQVVSILAILKLGAVYLPLNIEDPIDRINSIIQKAKVKLNLTQEEQNNKIKAENLVVRMDGLSSTPSVKLNISGIKNTDLAYIIFTSGSTGEPKGVMIDHRGAVNTILDINERFSVKETDRIYGLSKLNFDLSVYDVFGTLAAGAALIIPGDLANKDPKVWLSDIQKYQITIWNSVPALMQMLVDYIDHKNIKLLNSIRLILLSGDWIPLDLPEKARAIFGSSSDIISLGGATEASIWSVLYPITKTDAHWISIPYGYPMRNQKLYVLGDNLQTVPVGVSGELFIGGVGVAKGYFADEEKTQNSFIYSEKHKGYLYKTGDLGRLHPDGYIQFLGRKDNQVKINGYRIELGEIQNQLVMHPNIEKAIVTVDTSNNNQQLLAYVTVNSKQQLTMAVVINYLRTRLPSYMLPSAVIILDQFPLTSNGKIDRQSLPKPQQTEVDQSFQTNTEQELYKLWAELLNNERIGRNSHFFNCGGDSLLSVRLITQINKYFAMDLAIKTVFEYPVLSDMAGVLDILCSENASFNDEAFEKFEIGVI